MPYLYSRSRWLPGVYHVWARAVDGAWLFRDDDDRRHFEFLVDRHLSTVQRFDRRGRPFAWLRTSVLLCAHNLLSSHFHMVLWQRTEGGIEDLMSRVLPAYVRYYHRRYGTSGPLIEGGFRAREIRGRKSFLWRVAYVHNNHKRMGTDWPFSTHRRLIAEEPPGWLEATRVLEAFGGRSEYLRYMDAFRELRVEDPIAKP